MRDTSSPTLYPRWLLSTRLLLAALAIALLLALLNLNHFYRFAGRGAFDEFNFHLPAIRTFAQSWPMCDLRDYLSATTPGYHLMLALLDRAAGTSFIALHAANALFTVLLFIFINQTAASSLAVRAHRNVTPADLTRAILISLPLLASQYVVSSGVWLLPDNLAWVLVTLTLIFSVASLTHRRYLWPAFALLMMIACVRQIHIWLAAPIVVAAFAVPASAPGPTLSTEFKDALFASPASSFKRALIAACMCLPAALILLFFVELWDGLTPPTFHDQYPVDRTQPLLVRIINAPASPAFVLALLGTFGIFFSGFWLPPLLRDLRTRGALPWLLAAVIIALLCAVLPATTSSKDAGRWSGLWHLVNAAPVISGHTSPVIVVLAVLGAVTLVGYCCGMRLAHALVFLAAIAGFSAAQAASFQLWQRYNEPFVLLILILMTVMVLSQDHAPAHQPPLLTLLQRTRLAGPVALTALLLLATVQMFRSAVPLEWYNLKPGEERTKRLIRGDDSIKPIPMPLPR